MTEWFQAGYFTMSLLVKRGCDEVFQPLGEIIKIWGRVPFAPGPAPPPLQVHVLQTDACFISNRISNALNQSSILALTSMVLCVASGILRGSVIQNWITRRLSNLQDFYGFFCFSNRISLSSLTNKSQPVSEQTCLPQHMDGLCHGWRQALVESVRSNAQVLR